MKKLLLLSLFVVGLAVSALQAQTYAPVTLISGGTIGANSASNFALGTYTIDCRRQDTVAVYAGWQLAGTGTDNTGIWFIPSIDGSLTNIAKTEYDYVLVKANTGATRVHHFTNFSTKGYGYLHLWYVTNNDAGDALTNLIIKYSIKQY